MSELGLVAVLGASPSIAQGRFYPRLPQNVVFPAVRYNRINTKRTKDINGANVGPTQFSFQIDCMAKSYSQAKALAAQVMGRLDGYKGTWGSSQCRFCTLETENDFDEQDGDNITYWVSQRYMIWTNNE